jgi:hypothetical protein
VEVTIKQTVLEVVVVGTILQSLQLVLLCETMPCSNSNNNNSEMTVVVEWVVGTVGTKCHLSNSSSNNNKCHHQCKVEEVPLELVVGVVDHPVEEWEEKTCLLEVEDSKVQDGTMSHPQHNEDPCRIFLIMMMVLQSGVLQCLAKVDQEEVKVDILEEEEEWEEVWVDQIVEEEWLTMWVVLEAGEDKAKEWGEMVVVVVDGTLEDHKEIMISMLGVVVEAEVEAVVVDGEKTLERVGLGHGVNRTMLEEEALEDGESRRHPRRTILVVVGVDGEMMVSLILAIGVDHLKTR